MGIPEGLVGHATEDPMISHGHYTKVDGGHVISDQKVTECNGDAISTNSRDVPSANPEAKMDALEPVAVVGMSCRLPGGASNPERLWNMLKEGRSAWTKTPQDRFNQDSFHEPSSSTLKQGMTNTDGGHFLEENVKAFDASFFGISPMEATAMDPQHRLVLEIAYEAFENAGLTMSELSASDTGVYVGLWASDYQDILSRDADFPPTYQVTGTGPAIASNRVSYAFNLKGPSFTVDTGCSASLVALHQAVQSLRAGETDQCFVAGVNLLLDPQHFVYQSQLGMFSRSGRSFAFDHRAAESGGYGRGEGCTGVVLMPLSLAHQQGRHIRAVIRNSVTNQDGKTQGITVPSAAAQSAAIRKAYSQVNLPPFADYVEAHGTGTKVGDPIEAEAIADVLGAARKPGDPLPIGSIKGNIGHLESAAGLTGLLKAVLMLEHGAIPRQASFEKPNPNIDLDGLNLRIPLELESRAMERISVNSFGYGGTNVHLILDKAAPIEGSNSPSKSILALSDRGKTSCYLKSEGFAHEDTDISPKARLFVLSAASERSCQQIATGLVQYLSKRKGTAEENTQLLDHLEYTLQHRSLMDHRAGVLAADLETLTTELSKVAEQTITRAPSHHTSPRIAFVFSGQGAQYARMAQSLLGTWPQFTESMQRASESLKQCGCVWDLLQELLRSPEESRMENPSIAQPISTAVQLSLVDALEALGITPQAVIGHSSGEIAAAYSSKAISFEDAIKVSYHRGRLTEKLKLDGKSQSGSMLAVGASANLVQETIEKLGQAAIGRVTIACYNSPSSVTVSGDADVITSLKERLDGLDVWNRLLRTGGAAYHSPQMLQIASSYYEALQDIADSVTTSHISMISSVSGEVLGDQLLNAEYWVHNLVSPVLFDDALKSACMSKDGSRKIDLILEVGSHSQLDSPIKQTLRTLPESVANIRYTSTLKRGQDAHLCMMEMLRALFMQGVPVVYGNESRAALADTTLATFISTTLLTDLPPYPFDHTKSFWHESRISAAYRNRRNPPHELLGTLIRDNNPDEPRWRRYLNLKEVPWLRGHGIQGQTVFPAAGYIAMALQAAREATSTQTPEARIDRFVLRNISMSQALVLENGKSDLEVSLSLRPQAVSARKSSKLWKEFRIFTTDAGDVWTEHCRGLVQVVVHSGDTQSGDGLECMDLTQALLSSRAQHVKSKKLYHRARDLGLEWGSPFDNLTHIRTVDGASAAEASSSVVPDSPAGSASSTYTIHPAVLDSYLYHHVVAMLIFEDNITTPVVPTFIEKLIIAERDTTKPSSQLSNCYASRTSTPLTFDVSVAQHDDPSKMVLQAKGVALTKLPGLSTSDNRRRDLCHVTDWVTYMPEVTRNHVNKAYKAQISNQSVLAQHEALVALTKHYIKIALTSTSADDIPTGAYQRHWLNWMQTLSATDDDAECLRRAEADDGVIAQALKRIGPQLGDLLRGSVHPLSLLTEGNLLGRIYSEERCARCITQIAAYCRDLGRQNPNMRVLEIGAGTGSSSLPILQALQSSSNKLSASAYTFTDISTGFFPAAKKLLADFESIVDYKTLNAESGPEANGIESHSYDVVIACNVIHATSHVDNVLENVRSMLRPGGKFILMELTENQPYYNCIFGAFSGWWAGYDEGRTLSPLLSRLEWVQRLQRAGFTKNDSLFMDYPVPDGGSMTVFVSESPRPPSAMSPLDIDVVGMSQTSTDSLSLTERLKKKLWDRSLEASSVFSQVNGDKLSIILPEVCDKLAWDVSPDLFDAFKKRVITSRAVLFIIRTATTSDDLPLGNWVSGFCRSLRQEHTSARMITFEIASSLGECLEPLVAVLNSSTADLTVPNGEAELEFLERDRQLFVSRVCPEEELGGRIRQELGETRPKESLFMGERTLSAELSVPGVLDTIQWVDEPEIDAPLGADHVKLRLCAASINFKDVLIASGQLEGITKMRNDCSGIVLEVGVNMAGRFKPGDRVCALYSQPYANYPVVHGDCCYLVPEDMDLAAAASIPIVWATTYYSLVHAGKLKCGDRILIHSAAGAVGQAAIMLAKHVGAEIFTTCGSDAKVQLLVDEFGIRKDHIFSSRNTLFREEIQRLTGGHGVDVVLNSLSGEIFRESCNSLAPFGRFVEIGRKDLMEDALMPMEFLLKNITFSYVDFAHIIDVRKPLAREVMGEVMALFALGTIEPVRLTRFPISQIGDAFRLIQAGKHTGKVILTVEPEQTVPAVEPKPRLVELQSNATYIVVGGLGGLGRCIVDWLAERGAPYIVIFTRSAIVPEDAQPFLQRLSSSGIVVQIEQCDVSSEDSLAQAVCNMRESLPPVRGVIQAAMVLDDVLLDDMTVDQWRRATEPKIRGSWNLHKLLPQDLDFFVMLSSVVSIVGNIGSSNYGAACSFQDGLAHYRQRLGLSAYSINVGAVVEAGYVSENPEVAANLRRNGIGMITLAEFFAHLGHAIRGDRHYCQSSIGFVPSENDRGLGAAHYMNDKRFAHLSQGHQVGQQTMNTSDDVNAVLKAAKSYEEVLSAVRSAITRQLATILALDHAEIISERSLDSYGVDSLVGVELRNWISAYLHVNLPLLALWRTNSIDELAMVVTKGSRAKSGSAVERGKE
ncbi:KR domain-containing protein [Sarocladium implicatum]|nr:KR domain-containing protein [Sarocladium implicatum]